MTDETAATTEQAPQRAPYAVPVPGVGVVFTPAFLSRYGDALERLRSGRAASGRGLPAHRRGVVAGWVAEARARQAREIEAAQRRNGAPKGWQPPMTGEALRERRMAAGLTQRALAEEAKVARAALSELETPRPGRGRAIPETWDKLLGALTRAEAAQR